MFQSSPAPRRGRYLSRETADQYCTSVSILARTEARALPYVAVRVDIANLFQSSPAPRRGRYLECDVAAIAGKKFQSSPAPRRGRYFEGLVWC